MAELIVLYDGVCGLCTRSVQFIIRRDGPGRGPALAAEGERDGGRGRRLPANLPAGRERPAAGR